MARRKAKAPEAPEFYTAKTAERPKPPNGEVYTAKGADPKPKPTNTPFHSSH